MNVSEGKDGAVIGALVAAAGVGGALLDVHSDPDHNRTVLTMAGPAVEDAARHVTTLAVSLIDLRRHTGVHPRLGVVDVVPFVPLEGSSMADAVAARDRFAAWAGADLGVPCFSYGDSRRSLPDIRKQAFKELSPDAGPPAPHPSAGAICVGARPVLVAYNVWLGPGASVAEARRVATAIRGPALRALGLEVGGHAQVSMNLVAPFELGPAAAYDAVAALAPVGRAELVGLVPAAVLAATPEGRWTELDLGPGRTIECRLPD